MTGCAAVLAAALACACSDPSGPPLPGSPDHDIAYTVPIPSMALDSLHVTVQVNHWPGDTVCLVAPPVYADNPMLRERRANFRNLSVTDADGLPVTCVLDSVDMGLYRSLRIRAAAPLPMTAGYDISFDYENDIMPVPGIGPDSGYLQGSFLFAVPSLDGEPGLADLWRAPWDIGLTYDLGLAFGFRGDPAPAVAFRNAYELLFSTSALGGTLLAEGTAVGGQEFRMVCLQDTLFDPSLVSALADGFGLMTGDLVRLFGALGHPLTAILGINRAGGLEGMYAFSIHNPWEGDSAGWFPMVTAHEAAHCWLGLRVGEYDDPWWKEGTTNYVGFLIARRRGLCTAGLIEGALLADLAALPDVRDYAMSSPRVRSHLFAVDSGMANLVYTKGSQVCMLMDLRIRAATGNRVGFDSLLGAFVRQFDGRAFHRGDYVEFLGAGSGADIGGLFAQYVDIPGAIPVDVLTQAYDSLTALGAFGPSSLTRALRAPARPRPFLRW